MAKTNSTPAPVTETITVDNSALIANLLSTKAVSSGSKNVAAEFEKVARANDGIVNFKQAAEISPKSPSDAAYYFRQALGKVETVKSREGKTCWRVMTLPNGKPGYPAEVKALLAELQPKQ